MSTQNILDRLQLFSDLYQAERAVLKETPLFYDLYEAEIDAFICAAKHHRVPAGTRLLERGAANRSLFIVCHGEVEIARQRQFDDPETICRGAGEVFGEISFLDDCPATVTVTARESTTVLELDRETIAALLDRNARLAMHFWRNLVVILRARWANPWSDDVVVPTFPGMPQKMPQAQVAGGLAMV